MRKYRLTRQRAFCPMNGGRTAIVGSGTLLVSQRDVGGGHQVAFVEVAEGPFKGYVGVITFPEEAREVTALEQLAEVSE